MCKGSLSVIGEEPWWVILLTYLVPFVVMTTWDVMSKMLKQGDSTRYQGVSVADGSGTDADLEIQKELLKGEQHMNMRSGVVATAAI